MLARSTYISALNKSLLQRHTLRRCYSGSKSIQSNDDVVQGREINKSASSSDPQLQARPADAFFEDVMAGGPKPAVQIDAVLKQGRGFQLSTGMEIPEGVILLNGEAILWRPDTTFYKNGTIAMTNESFGVLDVSTTKPDMLILGTGNRNMLVDQLTRDYMHSLGIQLDTMDTRNAASTFNVLAAEGRSVAVALLPNRE